MAKCDQCGQDIDLDEDQEAHDRDTLLSTCADCRAYNTREQEREDRYNDPRR
jgi:hypothetical protein